MYSYSQQAAPAVVDRASFLRKVGVFTFLGLLVAAVTGVFSMFVIAPLVVHVAGGYGALGMILVTFFAAHYGCRAIVYKTGAKAAGLFIASACEGISLGFLLLVTVLRLGLENGVLTILQCLTLTVASGLGMLLYTSTTKRELSLVRAGLMTLGLPMLVLMALTFVFPIGGAIGIGISVLFVAFSAGALLYRLNAVVHQYPDGTHVEASYELTMALLVLFWNLLSLLNRMRR